MTRVQERSGENEDGGEQKSKMVGIRQIEAEASSRPPP